MGIPLDIFSLYLLRREGAGCRHHLLLRVGQPGFGNADASEYDRAAAIADAKRRALIEAYEAGPLARECRGAHASELVGELQARPVGDELCAEGGGFYVDLWIAETRFGRPWVVMGTAEGEELFWRAVSGDEDLAALDPVRPARRERAFFLAEQGSETRGE